MPFKLYDLKPVRKHIEKPDKKSVEDSSYKKHKKERNKKTLIPKVIFSFFVILTLLFLGTRLLKASHTKVTIYPQTEPFDSEISLNAKKDLAEIDFENKIVPAKILEKEFIVSEEFQTTHSSVETKAEGVIRVTNKYTKPVTLIANTRFLSSSSPTKMFLAKKGFTVPAGGSVDVKVVAAEAGSDYNIDPCTFSIPGLRNYSPQQLYSSVTGKSLDKMEGGSTGEVKIVTQDDLDAAEDELKLIAEDSGLKELKTMAGEEYVVLEKTIGTEILESDPVDVKVGQEKSTFIYQMKLKGNILAVKKDDLLAVINKFIISQQFAQQDIKEGSANIKTLESIVDATESITLNISFSLEMYPSIDLAAIKEVVKNQKASNIKRYILEMYQDMKTEPKVNFSPFFAGRASGDAEQIEIEVRFD
ncbi:MAG: hypothetical protein PHS27_02455 [Candidatus Pacebacteria bacterium]|nr:hypothetical protein [Candidatus Paceibacterota bacterium]